MTCRTLSLNPKLRIRKLSKTKPSRAYRPPKFLTRLGKQRGSKDKCQLATAHELVACQQILLWMTSSETPKALQASECTELLDLMTAK